MTYRTPTWAVPIRCGPAISRRGRFFILFPLQPFDFAHAGSVELVCWASGCPAQRNRLKVVNVDNVLTVKQVAQLLGISESLVRRRDMKVRLKAFIVGTRGIRFHREHVDAYLARNTVRASDQPDDIPVARKRRRKNLTDKHKLWQRESK
ncbi:helix-turn-helix domain-containing protein [Pseudodesulfovibrio thermohalotolerans]|uniref:helix-turn-helix domain-containing protein n=1 Tax=Pseudodesulfovibrio thermohalotolerans TaxID=2880651 RepID=UPI00384DD5EE